MIAALEMLATIIVFVGSTMFLAWAVICFADKKEYLLVLVTVCLILMSVAIMYGTICNWWHEVPFRRNDR